MSRKFKVLAVDDNPVNLSILEEMLGDDYQIKCAQNGSEAIRVAERFRPTITLLDVMMPGTDGLDICRRLRAMADLRDTVIIMVSAKAMPSEQAAGLRAGADDYLSKPFDEVEVLDLLRRYTAPRPVEADCPASNESDQEASIIL